MNFKFIFDKESIYGTLFINVKAVTEYPNTFEFKKNKPETYKMWSDMALKRYENNGDIEYHEFGCFLPEISKIACISYGNLGKNEDGSIKRNLVTISLSNKSEIDIIKQFFGILNNIYFASNHIILCGHNIIGHDIPFLVKRGLLYGLSIPTILKNSLNNKPWENRVLDTVNLWKFNGNEYISLKMISEFLKLKKNVKLIDASKISEKFYLKIKYNGWLDNLSINELNLIIQLIRRLNNM